MKDRELLELAAKAIGYEIEFPVNHATPILVIDENTCQYWCPLIDDGDALRLAAALKINIDFHDCCAWNRGHLGLVQEFWGGEFDPCYRRAIVRAAAEIGKSK